MISKKRGVFLPDNDDIKNIISQLDHLLIQSNKEIGEDHGTRLGQHIVERYKREGFKTPGTWLSSLPIYFIMCHSALAVNMNIKEEKLNLREGLHSGHSVSEFENEIRDDKLKFILYPTPSSTWGLIPGMYSVDSDNYEPDYIYNFKKNTIIKSLFKKDGEKRIYNKPNINNEKGEPIEDNTIQESLGGYFLPGLVVPQKDQSFTGNPLLEGALGIIKMRGNNSLTSRMRDKDGKMITLKKRISEAMKKRPELRTSKRWKDNGWNQDRVTDTKFFVMDDGWTNASREDKNLRKLLKSQDNLYMEEITETGEEGIYITLSCSNLNMTIVDERTGDAEPIYVTPDILDNHEMHNWVELRKKLINKYDEIFDYHKTQWDKMTDVINWEVLEDVSCYVHAQYLDDTEDIDDDEYMQGREVTLKERKGPITRHECYLSKYLGDHIKDHLSVPRYTTGEVGKGIKTRKKRYKKRKHKKSKTRKKRV